MALSPAPGLILPSLGFVLQEGRISEVGCVPVPGAGGGNAFSRGGSTRKLKPKPPGGSKPGSKNPSKSRPREVPHLGLPHSARLRSVERADAVRDEAPAEDQIDACLKLAAEGEAVRMKMAFQRMLPHFSALKPGSLVLEVGSRAGDMTLMFAERFPELYIQPTEGTGQSSPGLFMLLQERLALMKKELPKKRSRRQGQNESVARSRVLPPRHLDAGLLRSWKNKLTNQEIGCIFCINVLHYVSGMGVENFLVGCSEHLPVGGHVLICGPFFNNGEAGDSLLVYDAALRAYAASAERKLQWGCHDVSQLVALGAKAGFSLVAHEETDGVGGHSWILIVLRREKIQSRPPEPTHQLRRFSSATVGTVLQAS
ncbi:unnamed protein product [Effrenium voratum]|uniref:Uncharacterized protein n=1 Tax=Effrenium voratum TaxID=2562239 RepID=A0AA36IXA5_9DINO|nr:unnamed protein product [Effrenium voratum]